MGLSHELYQIKNGGNNMSNTSSSSSGGIGFGGALTLLFIGLKLTNQIDWSWWWVLSPVWIGLIFSVIVEAIKQIKK